ncbi:MAG: hypothetical protein HY681_14795 [Chloroflexi bacterium]|nr:hypothetical protein [Chloroflexota bacterium]
MEEGVFRVQLPKTVSKSDARALQDALKQVNGVANAGSLAARGVDPGTVMLWVQAAGGTLNAASKALPLLKQVVETIRGKSVTGVTLEFPGGMKLSVDKASPEDIERLVKAFAGGGG